MGREHGQEIHVARRLGCSKYVCNELRFLRWNAGVPTTAWLGGMQRLESELPWADGLKGLQRRRNKLDVDGKKLLCMRMEEETPHEADEH